MSQDTNIDPIEKNLEEIQKGSLSALEKELNELRRAKEENALQKRIEQLENEIEAIRKFIDEGGLDKKIEEAVAKLEQAKNTDSTIETLKGKPTLVDFWAEWCAPCKFIGTTVHELQEKYKDELNVLQIDTETEIGNKMYMEYAQKFGVNAIPFLLLFDKDGNYNDQLLGANPEKLKDMVNKLLSN